MSYRWKGENVATTEVADHLLMVGCVEEANVYGVKVPGNNDFSGMFSPNVLLELASQHVNSLYSSGHEGRIGMAALKLKENMDFDSTATYQHAKNYLPSYARPRFIRIQVSPAPTVIYQNTTLFLTPYFLSVRMLWSSLGHLSK